LRLRAAEQNLERLEDDVGELESQIDSLKRQSRQANRFKGLSADIRRAEAILLHLKWSVAKEQEGEAQSALASATSSVGEQAQLQMNAAKEQGIGAHQLPELREAEAKAAAALQRLTIARSQLQEEAERVRARQSEVEKRLVQYTEDIAREEQMVRDNADVLERLDAEERSLNGDNAGAEAREIETRAEFERAQAKLGESEAALARLTAERAEAAAERAQIERNLRDSAERRDRLVRQVDEVEKELSAVTAQIAALADPVEKQALVEEAEMALAQAEEAAFAAEAAVEAARGREAELRQPLQEARSTLGRVETEADTLARMINAGAADLFPAVLEAVRVEKGYETALGAALGEDLDAPTDSAAPAFWGDIAGAGADAPLPQGLVSLADFVRAPRQLQRRLVQIGIVEEADGARLQAALMPGQRLVSRAGALWRWDGFTASADAPTPAAQRLAQKNRLAELDLEVVEATKHLRLAEAGVAEAEAAIRRCVDGERTARDHWRGTQRTVSDAREALAAAERAAGQLSSRRAALEEGRSRLAETLRETQEQFAEA
ncbi:MAG: chromosome segregation protein SMC, partial [Alphaproteobacteria bacterium]